MPPILALRMTPSLSSVTLSFPISSFLLRPQDLPQLQALSVSEGTPTPTTALAAPSEKHNALNAADQPGHLQRHPRHNEDIGESSSPGDPYAAGPSALERELHACQEEVRSMNVQIHRMRYRISMRKVAEEWYPVRSSCSCHVPVPSPPFQLLFSVDDVLL